MSKTERALLLGGPCDFRTVEVRTDQHELLVFLPEERSLVAAARVEVDRLSQVPQRSDLHAARYTRQAQLAYRGAVVGAIFEWQETA